MVLLELVGDSSQEYEINQPVVIPKASPITALIIRSIHEEVAHSGRGITLNKLCNSDIWVINANAKVREIINKCVMCKKLRGFSQSKGWLICTLRELILRHHSPIAE